MYKQSKDTKVNICLSIGLEMPVLMAFMTQLGFRFNTTYKNALTRYLKQLDTQVTKRTLTDA